MKTSNVLAIIAALSSSGCPTIAPTPTPGNCEDPALLQQYDTQLLNSYASSGAFDINDQRNTYIQQTAQEIKNVADGNYRNARVFLKDGGRASNGGAFAGYQAEVFHERLGHVYNVVGMEMALYLYGHMHGLPEMDRFTYDNRVRQGVYNIEANIGYPDYSFVPQSMYPIAGEITRQAIMYIHGHEGGGHIDNVHARHFICNATTGVPPALNIQLESEADAEGTIKVYQSTGTGIGAIAGQEWIRVMASFVGETPNYPSSSTRGQIVRNKMRELGDGACADVLETKQCPSFSGSSFKVRSTSFETFTNAAYQKMIEDNGLIPFGSEEQFRAHYQNVDWAHWRTHELREELSLEAIEIYELTSE